MQRLSGGHFPSINMGCDPEFFFTREGAIIGAEEVLPVGGLEIPHNSDGSAGKVVIDGVQGEIQLVPGQCRANFNARLRSIMVGLRDLAATHKAEVSFAPVVEITPEGFNKLSPAAKLLGCAPSFNIHDAASSVGVDASKYLKRSAGGHIHIGWGGMKMPAKYHDSWIPYKVEDWQQKLVGVCDLVLGNTCVLLDRSPDAVERRRVYGRAGEYRTPKHGVEYRTLSNFWLHSPQLSSLVMGLSRLAVTITAWEEHFNYLMPKVDRSKVVAAINQNDWDLAWENFQPLAEWISQYVVFRADHNSGTPLWSGNIEDFKGFAKSVKQHGLAHWWPESPMTSWVNSATDHHGSGFENWLAKQANSGKLREAA